MEKRILPLTESMIGKIAAGEVVERPAAAIKELIENSLDAGATNITIEIRDGGITYFRVTDNGSGIDERDIRMAFERHATSKISTEEELNGIETLGFRGEALASIAAVSRVTCQTKTKTAVSGVRLVNEGGRITAIEPAACPDGTSITVKDLFFNTPVRLQFLKRPSTEAGYVADTVMHAILSRPDVAFRYISQGKTIYRSPGDGKLESAAYTIFGQEMFRKTTRPVEGHMNGLLVHGYVGVGESGRGNRNAELFFINGRYLTSSLLSTAVEEGTRERVMIGHFPMCILHLTMPYDSVDVNVHPNKLQVRFRKEAEVESALACLVKDALTDRDVFAQSEVIELEKKEDSVPITVSATETILPPVPEAAEINPEPAVTAFIPAHPVQSQTIVSPTPKMPFSRSGETFASYVPPVPAEPLPSGEQKFQFGDDMDDMGSGPVSFLPDKADEPAKLRLIGNVFNTYILLEYEDQLVMIDQHAAHERLNFDSMMKAYDQHRAGQELLVPMIEQVTPREMAVLEENKELLERLGFSVEPFGTGEVAIRSIPMILGQPQTAAFFREIVDELSGEPHGFTLEKRRTAILQAACKHAVKGGEKLSEEDMRDLVEQLIDRHVTPTCPHGRPLVVSLSHTELDRKFRRIQPN